MSVMTREDKITVLQDWVRKNSLTHDKNLKDACKLNSEDGEPIDWFDDVLAPMGWNCCDRCGALGDSELDFFWFDGFDWEDDNENDQRILRAVEQEGTDYCAVCWDCIEELKKKGAK